MKANDIAFVLTEDRRSLCKLCCELRAKHALYARTVKLEDGFDKSHFEPDGQRDFEQGLEPSSPEEYGPLGAS